jgi:hypothetical protein
MTYDSIKSALYTELSQQSPISRLFKERLRFDDFAALEAAGADANTLANALHLGVNRAQIDVPAPLANVVRVTDVISELRPFAADFTYLCHDYSR